MKSINKIRYNLIDAIRGLAIINMVAYHFMWNLVYIVGFDINWFTGTYAYIWQQWICHTFILISGFSFSFSKKPLKNGIVVFMCGALLTAVTVIVMPEVRIIFGILTFMGSAIIITSLFNWLLVKIPPFIGIVCSVSLFIFTRNISIGYLGFNGIYTLNIPQNLDRNLFTAYFGLPPSNFFSTDYFSLFPWLFLFFAGYFLHKILCKSKKAQKILSLNIKPLSFIGRKSLIIYMLHQPVLFAICMVLSYIM